MIPALSSYVPCLDLSVPGPVSEHQANDEKVAIFCHHARPEEGLGEEP